MAASGARYREPQDNRPGQGTRTAIIAADLVGYSSLVFLDPHAGIATLRETRSYIVGAIEMHGGNVLQTPGDFVLAAFDRPESALPAAAAAQSEILKHCMTRGTVEGGHWKIGVEVGEMFCVDSDYYGTPINVASRLQALAAAGEIWFSDQVPGRETFPEGFTVHNVGAKQLKNIGGKISVYRASHREYNKLLSREVRRGTLPARLFQHLRKPVVRLQRLKVPAGNDDLAFISVALVDEIHLVLSRLSGSLEVLHEEDAPDTRPDYTLVGTIQQAGPKIRLVCRLDARSSGRAVWAERFESDLTQSFNLQDRIASEIVSALQISLTEGEQAQLWKRGTSNGRAWESFQRGHDFERRYTRQSHARAKAYYEEALAQDAEYLSAIVAVGFCHLDEVRLGWSADEAASVNAAASIFERAKAISMNHPDVLALLAYINFFRGDHVEALETMTRAVALAPQSPEIVAYRGALLDLVGDFRGAVWSYTHALTLAPHSPAWMASNLGLSLLALGDSFEAERVYREVLDSHPDYVRACIGLTVSLVRQGRMRDAREMANRLMALDPAFTPEEWARSRPFPQRDLVESFVADLRLALTEAAEGG